MNHMQYTLSRYINLSILSVIFSISSFSMTSWGACPENLSIGWEPWEPYQYQDSNQNLTGLDIELIMAISSNAGCEILFEKIPWKRQLEYLKRGSVHLATGASKTQEREKYAYFSIPYRTESVKLYVRKGESSHYPLTHLEDIIDRIFQLGVSRGYYYGENYEKLIKNPVFKKHVQEVLSDELNYKKLIRKRINGFLADPASVASILRRDGSGGEIEAHPMEIYSTDIFIMFSKESISPAIVKTFNESLLQIKNNGKYQKILKKYLDLK